MAQATSFAPAVRHADYDSPEEARGQRADERSDVYSVGAILHEILTARRPMHRGSAAPSAANRHVPAEVDEIVLKAVAPNADSRFQSAATLAAELRIAAATLDVPGGAEDAGEPWEQPATHVGQVPHPEHRYPAGSAGLVAGGVLRIFPSWSENAERARTSSIPALRAASMTSVWTCET
jgi:serine/threonine protein kinase